MNDSSATDQAGIDVRPEYARRPLPPLSDPSEGLFGTTAILGAARMPPQAPFVTATARRIALLGTNHGCGEAGWLVLCGSLGGAEIQLKALSIAVDEEVQPFEISTGNGFWMAVCAKSDLRRVESALPKISLTATLVDRDGGAVSPMGRFSLQNVGTVSRIKRVFDSSSFQYPLPICGYTVGEGFHLSERLGEAFVASTAVLHPVVVPHAQPGQHLVIRARFRKEDAPPIRFRLTNAAGKELSLWRTGGSGRDSSYAVSLSELASETWTIDCSLNEGPISAQDERLMSWQAVDMRVVSFARSARKFIPVRRRLSPTSAEVGPGAFEIYRGRPVVWLLESSRVHVAARWAEKPGTRISLSGPMALDPSAIDALSVSVNGHHVTRLSSRVSSRRWQWDGMLEGRIPRKSSFGARVDVLSSVVVPISESDVRLASALLDRISLTGSVRSPEDTSPLGQRVPLSVRNGLYEELWNAAAQGTWIAEKGEVTIVVPAGARALRIHGDAATSRAAVESVRLEADGAPLHADVLAHEDGSWVATGWLGKKYSTARQIELTIRTGVDPTLNYPTLLLSGLDFE